MRAAGLVEVHEEHAELLGFLEHGVATVSSSRRQLPYVGVALDRGSAELLIWYSMAVERGGRPERNGRIDHRLVSALCETGELVHAGRASPPSTPVPAARPKQSAQYADVGSAVDEDLLDEVELPRFSGQSRSDVMAPSWRARLRKSRKQKRTRRIIEVLQSTWWSWKS